MEDKFKGILGDCIRELECMTPEEFEAREKASGVEQYYSVDYATCRNDFISLTPEEKKWIIDKANEMMKGE